MLLLPTWRAAGGFHRSGMPRIQFWVLGFCQTQTQASVASYGNDGNANDEDEEPPNSRWSSFAASPCQRIISSVECGPFATSLSLLTHSELLTRRDTACACSWLDKYDSAPLSRMSSYAKSPSKCCTAGARSTPCVLREFNHGSGDLPFCVALVEASSFPVSHGGNLFRATSSAAKESPRSKRSMND